MFEDDTIESLFETIERYEAKLRSVRFSLQIKHSNSKSYKMLIDKLFDNNRYRTYHEIVASTIYDCLIETIIWLERHIVPLEESDYKLKHAGKTFTII